MSDQVRQIAQRVKELREISDLTVAEVASKVELSPEEYEAYESGRVDMSISLLIKLSELYGVDTTTLLTGQAPRLSVCALTRRNMGTTVKRAKHYIYKNLAYNFNHRKIEPLLVTVEPGNGISLELSSSVMNQYGRQIKATVLDTLQRLGVENAAVTVVDKGALDCTLKARVECAVFRSCDASASNIPWGGAVR